MNAEKGLHDGHRNRVRERFLQNGLYTFRDIEAIELMLFYAIPRKDTHKLAIDLLDKFGSLSGVLEAPVEELKKSDLSESAAVLLKLIPQMCARYYQDKYLIQEKTMTADNVDEYVLRFFIGAEEEKLCLMLIDNSGHCTFCNIISEGTFSASEIDLQTIIKYAIRYNAVSAVIAHNHPSGLPIPSQSDIDATIMLRDELRDLCTYLRKTFGSNSMKESIAYLERLQKLY